MMAQKSCLKGSAYLEIGAATLVKKTTSELHAA